MEVVLITLIITTAANLVITLFGHITKSKCFNCCELDSEKASMNK